LCSGAEIFRRPAIGGTFAEKLLMRLRTKTLKTLKSQNSLRKQPKTGPVKNRKDYEITTTYLLCAVFDISFGEIERKMV
jgi:hypothetical protein